MDEFEQGLERILSSREKARQDEATRIAQAEIVGETQLRSEAEVEATRREEAKAKKKKEISLCTDFHEKNLRPLLDAINKRVASGKGVVSVFPDDPNAPIASVLRWEEGKDENVFGFRVGSLGVSSFATTVFAGEYDGKSRHDQSFEVVGDDLSEVKKHILKLLSNPQTTTVIPKADSFVGQQVEPKGLDPD